MFTRGLTSIFLWFSYGFPIFPWFSYGFPMVWNQRWTQRAAVPCRSASSCICHRSALRSSSSASGHGDFDDVMVLLMAVPTLMLLHWSPGRSEQRDSEGWEDHGNYGYNRNLCIIYIYIRIYNIIYVVYIYIYAVNQMRRFKGRNPEEWESVQCMII